MAWLRIRRKHLKKVCLMFWFQLMQSQKSLSVFSTSKRSTKVFAKNKKKNKKTNKQWVCIKTHAIHVNSLYWCYVHTHLPFSCKGRKHQIAIVSIGIKFFTTIRFPRGHKAISFRKLARKSAIFLRFKKKAAFWKCNMKKAFQSRQN